jgi:hypothetical protein
LPPVPPEKLISPIQSLDSPPAPPVAPEFTRPEAANAPTLVELGLVSEFLFKYTPGGAVAMLFKKTVDPGVNEKFDMLVYAPPPPPPVPVGTVAPSPIISILLFELFQSDGTIKEAERPEPIENPKILAAIIMPLDLKQQHPKIHRLNYKHNLRRCFY